MPDNEVIMRKIFWFSQKKRNSKKNEEIILEHHALKLCNESKCIFKNIEKNDFKNNDYIERTEYHIVAEGTKQHILLLEYMKTAWIWGHNFNADLISNI